MNLKFNGVSDTYRYEPQEERQPSVFNPVYKTCPGPASVNKKINKIQSLYVACRHSEARYLIRYVYYNIKLSRLQLLFKLSRKLQNMQYY